jgi:hypothetical protein
MTSTILKMLTCSVRVATTFQIAELLSHSRVKTARLLSSLQRGGWLEESCCALRSPSLSAPVRLWQPGDNQANFHALAHKLDLRWSLCEPKPCQVWWATPQAVAEFGGVGGSIKQNLQIEHDLAVTDVFLRRGRYADWRMEDVFDEGEFGTKIPDAVVTDKLGQITVIEIGGQYSAARLEAFHFAMDRLNLPYELW